MNDTTRRWLADAAERSGKTFAQFYLGSWLLAAGLLDTTFDVPNASAYDLLFTLNNAKAGVVGLALSLATSVGAKNVGAQDSASLLPADVDPPQPDGLPEPDDIPTTGSPEAGESIAAVAAIAAVVCLVLLFAFDLI